MPFEFDFPALLCTGVFSQAAEARGAVTVADKKEAESKAKRAARANDGGGRRQHGRRWMGR